MKSSPFSSHRLLVAANNDNSGSSSRIIHEAPDCGGLRSTYTRLAAKKPGKHATAEAITFSNTNIKRTATIGAQASRSGRHWFQARARTAKKPSRQLMRTKLSEAFRVKTNRLREGSSPLMLLLFLSSSLLLVALASFTLLIKLSLASPDQELLLSQPRQHWQLQEQLQSHRQQQPQQQQQQQQQHFQPHNHQGSHELQRPVQQQAIQLVAPPSQQTQSDASIGNNRPVPDIFSLAPSLTRQLRQEHKQQQQRSLVHLMQESAADQSEAADWTSAVEAFAQQPSMRAASFEQLPGDERRQRHQFVPYRPSKPTTPSINRQLMAPPPFYEFGLAPTKALQLETGGSNAEQSRDLFASMSTPDSQQMRDSGSLLNAAFQSPPNQHGPDNGGSQVIASNNPGRNTNGPNNNGALAVGSVSARSNAGEGSAVEDSMIKETLAAEASNQVSSSNPAKEEANISSESSEKSSNGAFGHNESSGSLGEQAQQLATEKGIEPRQRRRIFNRILKKAEWNHLFVELSKVFLRYFLDLALKDIIGKQSGASASGDTTTSRKKLDAQSELTDLLKDFVKTAISNI